MLTVDFVVVGAGIAGISVAAELAARATVVIVERESAVAYHSTSRSAALFTETYGPPVIRALTSASREFFTHSGVHGAGAPLSRARGMLLIAGAAENHRLDALADQLGSAGHIVSGDECVERVPILRRAHICGAYYEPGARDLDVDAITQGFLRMARERGATLLKGVEPRMSRENGRWVLAVGDELIYARTLVNAAGAWADEVAVSVGAKRQGLTPLRRTALLVDAPMGHDCAAWPAVMDANEQFYFKPDAGKLLLSPADETPSLPCDAQPEELDIAIAVDRVQQVADLSVRRVNHAWAGLRTFGPDRVPIVGFDPEITNLFWLAGQGGYGIQTSPALSHLAASLALNEGVPRRLAELGISAQSVSPRRPRGLPCST